MHADFSAKIIEKELFDFKELIDRKIKELSSCLEYCNFKKIEENILNELEYIFLSLSEDNSNLARNEIKENIIRIYKERSEISKLITGILIEGNLEHVHKLREKFNYLMPSNSEETIKTVRNFLLKYLIIGMLAQNEDYEKILKYSKCLEETLKNLTERTILIEDFFTNLLNKHILLNEDTILKLLKKYSIGNEQKTKLSDVKKFLQKLEEIGILFSLEEYETKIKRFYIKTVPPFVISEKYLQLAQNDFSKIFQQMLSFIIESYVAKKLYNLKSMNLEIYAFPSNQKGADFLLKINRDLQEYIIPVEVKVGKKRVGKAIKQVVFSMRKYNSKYGIIINGKDDITVYFPIGIKGSIIQIPYQYLIFLS